MLDVFITPPPNVKTELVQEFLYANFDIITSIEKLSSDRDLNLKVSTDDKSFGGIRIEDNVLITDDGYRILGPAIPKTVDDIESLMRS